MNIDLFELKNLLSDATELGAVKALVTAGVLKPYLSKAEAYRIYGRRQVDRWESEGLITLIKDGIASSKIRIDRMQIETVAKASNRRHYYQYHVK